MKYFIVLLNFVVCCQVTFAQTEYQAVFNVSENKAQGYHIGNIAKESNVLSAVPEGDKENIRFTYLNLDNKFSVYFDVNPITGALDTSGVVIDRETVCEFSLDCVMQFDIAVKSNKSRTFFLIVSVKVIILDENDNSPTFPKSVINLNISEGDSTGTEFRIDSAFDADMYGNNSVKGYSIDQAVDIFELVVTKNVDSFIVLKLKRSLDRELNESYTVKIIARDGGEPIRQGVLHINVYVLDENDNNPVFSLDKYNITIDENVAPNTVILTLSASDTDSGRNAEILYKISDRQSNIDTIRRIFSLNESSGELSVIKDLMTESTEFYEFNVVAADNGERPQITQTVVMVYVNGVGNKPPIIKVNLITPGNIGFVDIYENEPIDSFVAHVNVEDTDKGLNGDFSCNVTNAYFKLEKYLGYKVVVNGELDREKLATHNVTVTCHDEGTPKMTSSESFLVRILDLNDNTPTFGKDFYTVTMSENNQFMDIITQVTAKDDDIGVNGQIEYVLHAENKDRFIINNSTGVIYANRIFDMELEPIIVIRILGIDHGDVRRTGTATVSITLIDENDNNPIIIPAKPEFKIMENLKNGTSVGFLYATDGDSGNNGKFTFAIAPVSITFPFTLHPNGEFITKQILDREVQSRYDIPVTVTDMGSPPLSNTQYVTIFVVDDNDNEPKVTFPNDINDTVHFLYPVEVYNVVTTVAAYDVDEGENGTLSFSIVNGNEMGIFEIDSELGELAVRNFIDIKQDIMVTLTIEVKDKGIIPKSTEVILNVQLVYANATTSPIMDDGPGNKYIIISVVVVITTVVFAVAIVGVILFLRSVDRTKHGGETGSTMYSDSGISSRSDFQSLPPDGDMLANDDGKSKKKKEVSFSLEFSLDSLDGGRNVESTTDGDTQNRYYDGITPAVQHYGPLYSVQKQEKIDSHMKALKLQQYLWEAKSRDWDQTNIQVQQHPLGDSESETSRETNTCDSGRGGSEDDVSTSSPTTDDRRSFNFPDSRTNTKHVSFHPHPSQQYNNHSPREFAPSVRESTPVHSESIPPRPPAYRHPSTGYPTDLHTNNSKLAIKNFAQTYPNQDEMFNHRLPVHSSDPWRDYVQRMRHDSCSSMRSNEDDGGSTTTSGSYTLDPDEIDMDAYSNQRDLVV